MKKALIITLWISVIFELILGLGVLIFPMAMMKNFGITTVNNELLYLSTIVGWFCLLTTATAALAAIGVKQNLKVGFDLALLLGIFWIGIGLHLAITFQRPQHLILDAAKGFIIFVLAYSQRPKAVTGL